MITKMKTRLNGLIKRLNKCLMQIEKPSIQDVIVNIGVLEHSMAKAGWIRGSKMLVLTP